ncbi:MAG TPA: FG-GAP repeat protein [Kofleriaceae bacterium]|nr:FG-GAP repeat protein [Kofleriaceae bacterium]
MRAPILICVVALTTSCAELPEIDSRTAAVVELGEESRMLAARRLDGSATWFAEAVARDGDVFAFAELWWDTSSAPDPVFLTIFERSGEVWNLAARIQLPTSAGGYPSVALSGDTLVIGAPLDEGDAYRGGAAYVYLRTAAGWTLQQRLAPNNPREGVLFGKSVSIEGDLAVVGAPIWPGPDFGTGAAFVFQRSGSAWTQVGGARIAPDAVLGNDLGAAVSISGDRFAVSAPMHTHELLSFSGSVYTFVREGSGWTFETEIRSEPAVTSAELGSTLALDGNQLVATAPGEGSVQGAVYLFRHAGGVWSQVRRIRGSQLGQTSIGSADIDGSRLAISTYDAVHTYRKDGPWVYDAALFPAEGTRLARVALDGDSILVATTTPLQRVHLFEATAGWQQDGLFSPGAADGDPLDHFGTAVAVDDDTMLIGAPDTDGPGSNRGTVYVYTRQGRGWRLDDLDARGAAGRFGAAVAAVGADIAVGAPAYGANAGAVAFYQPGDFGWEGISSRRGFDGMRLGHSVDADGATGRVVAGGPGIGGGWIGVAEQSWGYNMGLWQPVGLDEGDGFGTDVAVHGIDIVGGAPGDDDRGQDAGAVHWTDSGVQEFVKITAPDGAAGDAFGSAVDMDAVSLAVAAPLRDGTREDDGAVYLYRRLADGWELDQILTAPQPRLRARFGSALAMEEGILAVTGDRSRTVYVYQRDLGGWTLAAVRPYAGDATAPRFGWSLAIGGGALLIGSSADDGFVPGTGTATRIELSITP